MPLCKLPRFLPKFGRAFPPDAMVEKAVTLIMEGFSKCLHRMFAVIENLGFGVFRQTAMLNEKHRGFSINVFL